MDSIVVLDFITIALGLYLIYIVFNMKKTGNINKIILAEQELKKVKDKQGFIDFIGNKTLIFGVAIIILGALGVLDQFITIPYYQYIEMVIFLIMVFFYMHYYRIAREKFVK